MNFFLNSGLINNNRNAPENKEFVQSVLLQTFSIMKKVNKTSVEQATILQKCSKQNYQLHLQKREQIRLATLNLLRPY